MTADAIPHYAKVEAVRLANEEGVRRGVPAIWSPRNVEGSVFLTAFARYIAATMPEPVDALLLEAREIAASIAKPNAYISFSAGSGSADLIREGRFDDDILVGTVLTALRRGVEIGKGGDA